MSKLENLGPLQLNFLSFIINLLVKFLILGFDDGKLSV